jgi:hypothetical protein
VTCSKIIFSISDGTAIELIPRYNIEKTAQIIKEHMKYESKGRIYLIMHVFIAFNISYLPVCFEYLYQLRHNIYLFYPVLCLTVKLGVPEDNTLCHIQFPRKHSSLKWMG